MKRLTSQPILVLSILVIVASVASIIASALMFVHTYNIRAQERTVLSEIDRALSSTTTTLGAQTPATTTTPTSPSTTIPAVTTVVPATSTMEPTTDFTPPSGNWAWSLDLKYYWVGSKIPFVTSRVWDDKPGYIQADLTYKGYNFKLEVGPDVVDRHIEGYDEALNEAYKGRDAEYAALIDSLNAATVVIKK